MKKLLFGLSFLFYSILSQAQSIPTGTSEIMEGLEKLKVVGSALYVAAHPDDENTLFITWLSKEKKVSTAYISMTRGDGGQNLIGTEQGALAGLLRTHELLGARSIDGGEQFFTRAIDFGYTKTTEEALNTWGKELILADLVYRIRKFKPDVIITRFPPDERAGHGHHSASAQLAAEAFDAAADPKIFPEQLKETEIWQAKRLVWNFYNRGFTNIPPEGESDYLQVSIGNYNPVLGKSYTEIAAEARSQHRSQGFGSEKVRNERIETVLHTKGKAAKNDLFDDVDLTWNRINGGTAAIPLINEIITNFNAQNPSASIPGLIQLLKFTESLPKNIWTERKKTEILALIQSCSGLYFDALAKSEAVSSGDSLKLELQIVNRSNLKMNVKSVSINDESIPRLSNTGLEENKMARNSISYFVSLNTPITQPYWLWKENQGGHYEIEEKYRNLPMAPQTFILKTKINMEGTEIEFTNPVRYKKVEPSLGEVYQNLEVRPAVSLTPDKDLIVFNTNTTKEIKLTLKSAADNISGMLRIILPAGWKSSSMQIPFELKNKYDERTFIFNVTSPATESNGFISFAAEVNGINYDRGLKKIEYPHIPLITLFPESKVKVSNLDIKINGKLVGYIMGAGDEMPKAIEDLGYTVTLLSEKDLSSSLSAYQAIIVGIRAYNTLDWLPFYHEKLMNYVKAGGNLITQYNTSSSNAKFENLMGPYEIKLGRDRVSEEDAEIKILKPAHVLLNKPNKILPSDFDGWIQERGLYYPQTWSDKYETIFSMHDKNESEKLSSVLYTPYGKGNYVYTGISFFRELPAGITGAYKLFANMISATHK